MKKTRALDGVGSDETVIVRDLFAGVQPVISSNVYVAYIVYTRHVTNRCAHQYSIYVNLVLTLNVYRTEAEGLLASNIVVNREFVKYTLILNQTILA